MRNMRLTKILVQHRTELCEEEWSAEGERQQCGDLAHGVVCARGHAGTFVVDRVHDNSRERGNADRHAEPQKRGRREVGYPVRAADTGSREQKIAECGDGRTNDERKTSSPSCKQTAGPGREKK